MTTDILDHSASSSRALTLQACPARALWLPLFPSFLPSPFSLLSVPTPLLTDTTRHPETLCVPSTREHPLSQEVSYCQRWHQCPALLPLPCPVSWLQVYALKGGRDPTSSMEAPRDPKMLLPLCLWITSNLSQGLEPPDPPSPLQHLTIWNSQSPGLRLLSLGL